MITCVQHLFLERETAFFLYYYNHLFSLIELFLLFIEIGLVSHFLRDYSIYYLVSWGFSG